MKIKDLAGTGISGAKQTGGNIVLCAGSMGYLLHRRRVKRKQRGQANKPTKQPTNQATKTTHPVALRPPPRPPSRLDLRSIHPSVRPSVRPSIHPSIHHPITKIAYPSSTVSRKQSRPANQQINTPKRHILPPIHDPSIIMCFP